MSKELNDLVREKMEQDPEAGPHEIARAVAMATPEAIVREFYAQALVPTVRALMRAERNTALSGTMNKSAKVEQRKAWFARFKNTKLHVERRSGSVCVTEPATI